MNKRIRIGLNKFTFLLVMVYLLIGTGVTYAYFAFNYENTSTIVGNVVNVDADLTVERVVGTDEKLVPMLDDALGNALLGSENGACIDSLGNLSCQVYKITLTNNASRLQHLVGTIELYAKDGTDNAYSNLKWQELTDEDSLKDGSIVNGMNKSILVSGLTLESKESKTWYVGVWLSEIDSDQKELDKGEFGGEVKFEVIDSIISGTVGNFYNDFTEKVMISNAISDESIDFSKSSSSSGTNGIYLRNITQNDTYPIYYYRGNVENNNLIFADFCWKIVRTTETGGLKLLYNGTPTDDYATYETISSDGYNVTTNTGFSFTSSNNFWSNSESGTEILEFKVSSDGNYIMEIDQYSDGPSGRLMIYLNGELLYSGSSQSPFNLIMKELKTTDVIKVESSSDVHAVSVDFYLKKGVGEFFNNICNTISDETVISSKSFSTSSTSLAYAGYMYGDVYEYTRKSMSSDTTEYTFGNSVSYSNGTYTLTGGTTSGAYSSLYKGGLNNYHYTCFNDSNTCTNVYYIYYTSSSYAYYITLNNGKKVEDVLMEMLGADDTNIANYNTISSTIKGNNTTEGTLDYWYYTNIYDTTYHDMIEDTVWCNDRSIYSLGGWNPDGGGTYSNYQLYFGAYGRLKSTYEPIVTCPRKVDSFTVDSLNGNGNLDYPVGLLTIDEVMLAGRTGSYLAARSFGLLSPYSNTSSLIEAGVNENGEISTAIYGVRPSISLKNGFSLTGNGDGTATNPYVIATD